MNFIVQLRSNYRLRVGLALILGIVWLSLLLDLHDQNRALQDRYRQVASQLARVDSQQKQTQWLTRAQEAKDALAGVEARLWQNPTVGLTQAQLRDSLLQQLLQAKAVQYRVKVSESSGDKSDSKSGRSGDPADLVRVRAEVELNTDPVVLNNLLTAIATGEHQVVVESLNVKLPRTTMTVVSWHKLQPIAAGSGVSAANALQPAAAH
ncbi:MAG: hypothetical protein P4L91_18450 [Burkholderiaceae bacterium]|nr:hypothetical protein [Burkholderiaceae bacterium]